MVGSISPTLRSSIDGYKTVCPGEEVYFTCNVQNSDSLTWRSNQYIGRNTVVEFNRNFDRVGSGKSTSLPSGGITLLQLASLTAKELEANMKIEIVNGVANASVSCTNDAQQSEIRYLLLAGEFISTLSLTCYCCHTIHALTYHDS